jgi:hypothetical protein
VGRGDKDRVRPESFIDQFDLIAGPSTGSILAVGLAMGIPPADLVELCRRQGTTFFSKMLPDKRYVTRTLGGGYAQWVMPITNLFFAAQESGADDLSRLLLGLTRLNRVNDFVRDLPALDDAKAVESLIGRGAEVAEREFKYVRGRFLDCSVAPPWQRY